MTLTYSNTTTSTRQRLVRLALILMLLLPGLSACDSVDPQLDDTAPAEALFSVAEGTPEALSLQNKVPLISSPIDGTWNHRAPVPEWVRFSTERVEWGKAGLRFIGSFEGQTECSDFAGTFSVPSAGALTIEMRKVSPVRCQTLKEEALIAGLRGARHYKLDGSVLYVSGSQGVSSVGGSQGVLVLENTRFLGPPVPVDKE